MTSINEKRWASVVNRDASVDSEFVYAVKTTGIFCLPSCPSKLAKRENVRFFDSAQQAIDAGFRPCKRCQPTTAKRQANKHLDKINKACQLIQDAEAALSLDDLSKSVGLSPYHFHRLFKEVLGLTPKAYASAVKAQKFRDALSHQAKVTDAIYDAGFGSDSRFYEKSDKILGMSAKTYRKGGKDSVIYFAVGRCTFGDILVAQSETGVCAIFLGDNPQALIQQLQDQFANAELVGADNSFERVVASVVGFIENPFQHIDLPLDIKGTAFQELVWNALREIPPGQTVSYSEIAARIGKPRAIRAVASACAANKLAVIIPCHRVVRTDGSLSGYRWGLDRKAELIRHEENMNNASL